MSLAISLIAHDKWPITSYHFAPEGGGARGEAVLLLPSAPWDVMRVSWLQRQLGEQLCRMGYDVFRLDYCGTGDSVAPMAEMNFHHWQKEIEAVRESIRTRVKKIHVVGLRLGGTLALLSAQNFSYRSIHLLDPVLGGRKYWQTLLAMSDEFFDHLRRYGSNAEREAKMHSYPLDRVWQSSLEAIDLLDFSGRGRRLFLYATDENPDYSQFKTNMFKSEREFKFQHLEEPFAWDEVKKLNFQHFCRGTLQAVIQSFAEI